MIQLKGGVIAEEHAGASVAASEASARNHSYSGSSILNPNHSCSGSSTGTAGRKFSVGGGFGALTRKSSNVSEGRPPVGRRNSAGAALFPLMTAAPPSFFDADDVMVMAAAAAVAASEKTPQWEAWWQHRQQERQQGQERPHRRSKSDGGCASSSASSSSGSGLSTLTVPTGDDLYHMPPPPPMGLQQSQRGGQMRVSLGGGRLSPLRQSISGGLLAGADGGLRRSGIGSGGMRESIPGIPRSQFQMYYMPEALHQVRGRGGGMES